MTQRRRRRPQQVRSVRRPAACGCRARLKLETLESRLPLAGVTVEGIAFADVDHDGIRGSDEPVWPGHTLILDLNGNGLHDEASEPAVTTDARGRYEFPSLPREAVEQFFALDSAFGRVRVDLPLVSRPTLAATATIRIDDTAIGPQPIDFSWADVTGAAVGGPTSERFVVATAVSGRVEKWTDGVWRDVGAPPSSGSPADLLARLHSRVIAPGDAVRWVPSADNVGQASAQAFDVKGWNAAGVSDGTSLVSFKGAAPLTFSQQRAPLVTLVSAYAAAPATVTLPSYESQVWPVDDNLTIHYGTREDTLLLDFVLTNNNDGWMALGFGEFMFPTDTIVVWWDFAGRIPLVWDAYNPGIPTIPNFPAPLEDTNLYLRDPAGSPLDNKDNLTGVTGVRAGGTILIHVERLLNTGDIFDFAIEPNMEFNVIAAYNSRLGFNTAGVAPPQPEHTATGATRWLL